MNKQKKFRTVSVILSSVFAVMGLFLILNPQISEKIMGIIIGVIFIVYGLSRVIGYIFSAGLKEESVFDFIAGLLNAGIGMFIIMYHGAVLKTAAVIVAVTVCFEGIMRIMTAFDLKKAGYSKWQREMIAGTAAILLSLFVIFNPFKAVMAVYISFGIALLILGIFHMYTSAGIMKIIEILEPVETTATVSDEESEKLPLNDDDKDE